MLKFLGSQSREDPAPAKNEVFLVKHGGLAGGDGALSFLQFDLCPAVGKGSDDGGGAGVIIPDFDGGVDFGGGNLEGNPIAAIHRELGAIEGAVVAHHNPVSPGIE